MISSLLQEPNNTHIMHVNVACLTLLRQMRKARSFVYLLSDAVEAGFNGQECYIGTLHHAIQAYKIITEFWYNYYTHTAAALIFNLTVYQADIQPSANIVLDTADKTEKKQQRGFFRSCLLSYVCLRFLSRRGKGLQLFYSCTHCLQP